MTTKNQIMLGLGIVLCMLSAAVLLCGIVMAGPIEGTRITPPLQFCAVIVQLCAVALTMRAMLGPETTLQRWKLLQDYEDVEAGADGLGARTYVVFVDEYGNSCQVSRELAEKKPKLFKRVA
jgi:hypothetical protein